MAQIQIQHLTFAYPTGSENIFEDVSLQIDTNWKLGLIGRNGRGKTTLLRLLQNQYEQYEYAGTIQSPVLFDYFPYPVADEQKQTREIVQKINPEVEEWQIDRELSYLDVDPEVLDRPFETLSNGERTKVLLAALFLKEGHFLLIDEPTNHLDLHGRQLVAQYLKRKRGFILVSHDRSFLDGCIDHVLAINKTSMDIQSGNYSSWLQNFEQRQSGELARHTQLKKEIAFMQKSARQRADWSKKTEAQKFGNGPVDRGFIGHKSAKMMKRAKAIEKRRADAIEQKSGLLQDLETIDDLKLFPLHDISGDLIGLDEVEIFYDGHPVSRPVSFRIQDKERIVFNGANGSGKSSLLKLICGSSLSGADLEYQGTLYKPARLRISYVCQDPSFLKGDLKTYARDQKIDESLFKAILRKMGFERAQFEKQMEDFSAGQKKKVLIAGSLCQKAHLYIWDEPLNYIDLDSRRQIEELIQRFEPTMILVEHDAAFQQAVATQIVKIESAKTVREMNRIEKQAK